MLTLLPFAVIYALSTPNYTKAPLLPSAGKRAASHQTAASSPCRIEWSVSVGDYSGDGIIRSQITADLDGTVFAVGNGVLGSTHPGMNIDLAPGPHTVTVRNTGAVLAFYDGALFVFPPAYPAPEITFVNFSGNAVEPGQVDTFTFTMPGIAPPPQTCPSYTPIRYYQNPGPGLFGLAITPRPAPTDKCYAPAPDYRAWSRCKGCALCAAAAMLTTFSGSLSSITPGDLDGYLKRTDVRGWKSPGDDINWTAVALAARERGGQVAFVRKDDSVGDYNGYLEQHFCKNLERVILDLAERVYDRDPSTGLATLLRKGRHFVVVTGEKDNDWSVFDPGWTSVPEPAQTSLNAHFNGFTITNSKGISEFHQFDKSGLNAIICNSGSASSSFSVVGQCPIELLLSDPLGHRLGHVGDPGTDVFEVTDGSYFRDYPATCEDGDDGVTASDDVNGSKTVYVPAPETGQYQITVTGTDAGIYTLEFRGTGPDGVLESHNVFGLTARGLKTSYKVEYTGGASGDSFGVVVHVVGFADVQSEIAIAQQLGLIDNEGIANGLSQKLASAAAFRSEGDRATASNILHAFIRDLSAQSGKHVSVDVAKLLISDAFSLVD